MSVAEIGVTYQRPLPAEMLGIVGKISEIPANSRFSQSQEPMGIVANPISWPASLLPLGGDRPAVARHRNQSTTNDFRNGPRWSRADDQVAPFFCCRHAIGASILGRSCTASCDW